MSYERFLHDLQQYDPRLAEFGSVLRQLDVPGRKVLLDISRVQVLPHIGTRVRKRLATPLNEVLLTINDGKWRLRDYVMTIPEFQSPVFSGFLSMLIRNAPYDDYESAEKVMWSTFEKEVMAAQETYHPIQFNWWAILSSSRQYRHSTPLSPDYPINGDLHDYLHDSLCAARSTLRDTIFYPDYSKKTIGKEATRNVEIFLENELLELPEDYEGVSTWLLERVYSRLGFKMDGPTEMRWAWKFNDLKPRIYYARGPDVYYPSRFIQPIFNVIVDAIEATHRRLRFFSASMNVPMDEDLFIYDYASFTSTLHEIRNFTHDLATFLRGTTARFADTFYGIMVYDLGDVMDGFNAACNFDPMFALSGLPGFSTEDVLTHNCGMLGVPGNISSCTLLHGIHLLIVLQNKLGKVVGDDATGVGKIDSKVELVGMLSNIGRISEEKMEFWAFEDSEREIGSTTWQYCKRPYDRHLSRVVSGSQLVFPSLATILSLSDGIHKTESSSGFEFYKKVAGMLTSFARTVNDTPMTDEERAFCDTFLKIAIRHSGLERFEKGRQGGRNVALIYPKYISKAGFEEDMVEAHWNCGVRLPLENVPFDDAEYDPAVTGYMRMNKALKLSRDMGWSSVEPCFEYIVVRDDPDRFCRAITKQCRPMYLYKVFESCPDWLSSLILVDPYELDDPFSIQELDDEPLLGILAEIM